MEEQATCVREYSTFYPGVLPAPSIQFSYVHNGLDSSCGEVAGAVTMMHIAMAIMQVPLARARTRSDPCPSFCFPQLHFPQTPPPRDEANSTRKASQSRVSDCCVSILSSFFINATSSRVAIASRAEAGSRLTYATTFLTESDPALPRPSDHQSHHHIPRHRLSLGHSAPPA